MRLPIVIALLLIGCENAAHADGRPSPRLDAVRVGFPTYVESNDAAAIPTGLFKSGFWVPLEVRITAGADGITHGKVHVETADSDDIQTVYTVPFSAPANSSFSVWAYTKPGSLRTSITATVEADQHRLRMTNAWDSIDVADTLCLYLGSNPSALSRSLSASQAAESGNRNTGKCRIASVDNAQSLPDRWFGYAALDLIILPTGNRSFLDPLLRGDTERKRALAESVRRGGHLLISCGRNRSALQEISRELGIPMPFSDGGPLPTRTLDLLRTWTAGHHSFPVTGPVFLNGIRLMPTSGEPYESLLPTRLDDQLSPLVIRWPWGNGQVTLVAFDLDDAPFTSWAGQADFWKVLLPRCGVKPAILAPGGAQAVPADSGASDVATFLQQDLDRFPEVSVIPFGWVTLLVLGFVMIVGPLGYFFHTRVLGRLLLNWVIFSVAVVSVTAAACVAAYALKGTELRINKLDLIDIDWAGRRCYGTTWFTIYSPRTESYTVGIEPATPLWTTTDGAADGSEVVSWFGRPEAGFGGYERPRSQIVFRRSYAYGPNARELENVPIPVWSSKSFTASWESRPNSELPSSRLFRREHMSGIGGNVINPLPVVLTDVALIYGETESQVKVYQLGTMVPGQSKPIAAAQEMQLSQWLTSGGASNDRSGLMRRIMFYDASANLDGIRNRALNKLDHSWRRALRNSAILVGHTARVEGPAEKATQDATSPSRLWLGGLPRTGEVRPPLAGTLTQDTYVRIFVSLLPGPGSASTQPNP